MCQSCNANSIDSCWTGAFFEYTDFSILTFSSIELQIISNPHIRRAHFAEVGIFENYAPAEGEVADASND